MRKVKLLCTCSVVLLLLSIVGSIAVSGRAHAAGMIVINNADYSSSTALPIQNSSDVISVAQNVAPGIVINDADYMSFAALPVQSFQPLAITNVSQSPTKDNVLPTDEVSVNATVSDSMCNVTQVLLSYTNGSGAWVTAPSMTPLGGNIWNSTIPRFQAGTTVTYVVNATDSLGDTVTTEQSYTLQYIVTPEFQPFMLLPLCMIITLLAAMILKKKRNLKRSPVSTWL